MTTTPEKISQLRRLHAESAMVAGPHYRKAACEELPGLLDDIEAAQRREQMLREALTRVNCIANNMSALPSIKIVDICETALAATEVK